MAKPPPLPPSVQMSTRGLRELAYAKSLLENPGLAARLSNLIGAPLEKGMKLLPANWTSVVYKATHNALIKAMEAALLTMRTRKPRKASLRFHKILAGATGGVGGIFGLAALPVELPLSTTIMLRSIADIARSEGHDLQAVTVRLACLEVFALGGENPSDDYVRSGYWAVRAALAKSISEAASYLVQRGVLEKSAPAVVQLVSAVATRFGVIVSEEVAAKAVPIVGAASGSIINVLFMNHFQEMARGHFIVKRLEKKYGTQFVRAVYCSLKA